jgi:hypothetical protein
MIANISASDSDPKTMAMAECKPLARTETNKGCNPRRIIASLLQINSLHVGFNMFSSENGMRSTRW